MAVAYASADLHIICQRLAIHKRSKLAASLLIFIFLRLALLNFETLQSLRLRRQLLLPSNHCVLEFKTEQILNQVALHPAILK